MFDYPISIEKLSEYGTLGAPPESTSIDLKTRKAHFVNRLKREERAADQITQDIDEISDKIASLNELAVTISDPKREEYDKQHPPFQLLKISTSKAEFFEGRRDLLLLLRKAVVVFLREKGVDCYHPSDYTRTDFSSDFSPVELFGEVK